MTTPFGPAYAALYDDVYREKDYEAECDLIVEAFHRFAPFPVLHVLDLGCGTGNHALPLARRGCRVVGIDRAAGMIERAVRKAEGTPNRPEFLIGDLASVALGRQFDAVLMMFAVLGYQTRNADVVAALTNVRRHLRTGGLLILDIWYGPAVLAQRPQDRVRVVATQDGKLLRLSRGTLDALHQTCRVHFHYWHVQPSGAPVETEEEHLVRFFFPRELELLLDVAGMKLVRLAEFPTLDRDPDETTWNALVVAQGR